MSSTSKSLPCPSLLRLGTLIGLDVTQESAELIGELLGLSFDFGVLVLSIDLSILHFFKHLVSLFRFPIVLVRYLLPKLLFSLHFLLLSLLLVLPCLVFLLSSVGSIL